VVMVSLLVQPYTRNSAVYTDECTTCLILFYQGALVTLVRRITGTDPG
jgi:hypothetical protein